ncbi:hypothetical protein TNCV_4600171 [Trichonephila clavipes]|nr:hypothetical protein TNCV_4600171 [Trichonephila clavipes]
MTVANGANARTCSLTRVALCACARRQRAWLEIQLDDDSTTDSTTANLTVRCPQRYLFLFFMETRGESETYKKDGTDKDYTTDTQRFNIP